MKKIGKLIILVCILYTSCATFRKSTTNAKQLGNIWNNQMQPIDVKRMDELIKENNLNPLIGGKTSSNKDSVFFYTKDNDKVLARLTYFPIIPFDINSAKSDLSNINFEARYQQITGLFDSSEYGYKTISKGSHQNGYEWIFVIEYTDSNAPDKCRYFSINAYQNERMLTSTILTDPAHRAEAIELVNSFTKSVANVTLELK